ncbi:hypothetical protein M3231_17255 [Neobacillus mesonae]|nr:hypothetical protein [Neobacillus mesonae]
MTVYTDMKDSDLSAAAFEGDFNAYEELIRRNSKPMFLLASVTARRQEAGMGLMAHAISLTWQYRRKIKDEKKLLEFLYKQIWKSAEKFSVAGEETANRSEALEVQEGVWQSSRQMMNHRSLIVEDTLSRMNAEQRTVFLLKYAAKLGQEETVMYGFRSEVQLEKRLIEALTMVFREAEEQKEDIGEVFLLRHFEKEHEAITLLPDDKKMEAFIQQGLDEAKTGRTVKGRKRKRIAWTAAVTAAALFLISFIYQWVPGGAGEVQAFDQSYWESTLDRDSYSLERLKNGDYVPVGKVLPEENGIRLIIDGAMQTSDGLMLWYRLENTKGKEAPMLEDVVLWDEVNHQIGIESDNMDGSTRMMKDGNKTYGKLAVSKLLSHVFLTSAQELIITAFVDEGQDFRWATFEVTVPEFPVKPAIEIEVNQSFTIQGETFHIPYLWLTTNETLVEIKSDPANTASTEQLIDPTLQVTRESSLGREIEVKRGEYGSETVLYFDSIYYDDYTDLELQINGVRHFEKPADPTIKINTDTGEIVEAPESFAEEVKVGEVDDASFYIYFNQSDDFNYSMENQYLDAEGNIYFPQGNEWSSERVAFKLTDFDYAQPLTFRFSSYGERRYTSVEELMESEDRVNISLVKKY